MIRRDRRRYQAHPVREESVLALVATAAALLVALWLFCGLALALLEEGPR